MINFAKVVEKYPNSSKIADAKLKPKGVGRQFKQESYRKAPNLTQGDIYNKNGDRVYFKPMNE